MKPDTRFTILRTVGRDELGEVSEAFDNQTGRQVALKSFDVWATQSNSSRRRMEEALVALHGKGPARTPRPTALALSREGAWLASEWVSAPALSFFVEKMGALAPEIAAQIGCGVLDALIEIHETGQAHGGLTPSKIILTQGFSAGGVVVTDPFQSLLYHANDPAEALKAARPLFFGNPRYLSPEQARGQEPTAASDVYAVGLLLYEMISGRPAFNQATPQELIHAQATTAPTPIRQVKPDAPVSADLEAIIQLALAKEPPARFGSALAMRRALGSCRTTPFNEAEEMGAAPMARVRGEAIEELFIAAPAVDAATLEAERVAAQQAEALRLAEEMRQQQEAAAAQKARMEAEHAAAVAAQAAEAAAQAAREAAQRQEEQEAAARALIAEQAAKDEAARRAAQEAAAQRAARELAGDDTAILPVGEAIALSPDEKIAAWFRKGEDAEYLEDRKIETTMMTRGENVRVSNRRATGVLVSVTALILVAVVAIYSVGLALG